VALVAACGPLASGEEGVRFQSGGDLAAAGETVEVPEAVDGDVMVAGAYVRFSGDAGGSVLAVGGSQVVGGTVLGSVRAAGGRVELTGSVERNATLLGNDLRVRDGAVIGLNAYLVGTSVEQRGAVRGHLRIAGRDVVLDGPVSGNVDVVADRLTVGPSARIDGDLTAQVREGGLSIDPAAIVVGTRDLVEVPGPSMASRILFGAGRAAAFLFAGFILLLLAPELGQSAGRLPERPLPALGLGLLWIVAIPVIAFAVAVTVIGIPLAMMVAVLYLCALYLAPALPGAWLGSLLLDRPGGEPTRTPRAFLFGGALLAVAMLLPWVGFPVRVLATAAGFGAVVLQIRARLAG
jgi:cytoskeletal protein CcmA (bactofilin family)